MIRPSALIALGAAGVFAAGALAQPAAPLDVRAAMQQRVNPAMLAIWEVSNNALDDNGAIDPAQMDDGKWAAIADAAGQLAEASRDMAAAATFVAAAPDNAEVAEGGIAMAAVQQHLDRDPAGFRQMAAAMAEHADHIALAAHAKDAQAAGDLIGGTDAMCESCHSVFWYPE